MLPLLLIILLLEGFITISVEVLTIRQLIPFYGGSVLITSVIIGVFLLFLAIGYWRGGSYRQNYYQQLSRNFTLSLLWIGVGLSYLLISFYYYFSVVLMGLPFLLSLFVYLLIALAPIVYWMGQTVPITTNLFNQEQGVSRISGRALFLSTVGSFLGALLTSLVLFQYLGVAWTIVINCLLLLFLVAYLNVQSKQGLVSTIVLFFSLLFILLLNVNFEKSYFEKTNNYANYRVEDLPDFSRILQVNDSYSSKITPDKKAFPYIEMIRDILFKQMKLRHKKILVIGAGGFSLTAKSTYQNEIEYVDIDPAIQSIAEKHFLKAPIKGQFTGLDARQFLQQNKHQWDVILSDVYSNQSTIPPLLLTREYFQSLADHLKPDGILIVNIIANPFFQNSYSRTVYDTIHAVFPYCAIIPLTFDHDTSNVLYVCPNLVEKNRAVYHDDRTTATLDFFKARR